VNLKGTLALLVLQTLAEGPNHGYRIAQTIKKRSKGVLDFQEGALYPCLHGLEKQGLLESSESVEQGRTRRYYQLTQKGRRELAAQRQEWEKVFKAVRLVLEGSS
jgi:transcriptional regulator